MEEGNIIYSIVGRIVERMTWLFASPPRLASWEIYCIFMEIQTQKYSVFWSLKKKIHRLISQIWSSLQSVNAGSLLRNQFTSLIPDFLFTTSTLFWPSYNLFSEHLIKYSLIHPFICRQGSLLTASLGVTDCKQVFKCPWAQRTDVYYRE